MLIRHLRILLTIALLTVVGVSDAWAAGRYPARCRATTELNVRSGPGKDYGKTGLLNANDPVTVNSTARSTGGDEWGVIDHGTRRGCISMRHVQYGYPVEARQPHRNVVKKSRAA